MNTKIDTIRAEFLSIIDKIRADYSYRQKTLTVFLVVAGVFLLFYWTSLAVNKSIGNSQKDIATMDEKIERVEKLAVNMVNAGDVKLLERGLLSQVQLLGSALNIERNLRDIKLVSTVNNQEQVSFRTENMVYGDILRLINAIEMFDNLWIKSISINKRFDNEKRVDVVWNVVRSS